MARIFSSGFELNSIVAGVEFDAQTAGVIFTSPVRSGVYSLKCAPSATTSSVVYNFSTSDLQGVFYARAYIYIVTAPAANAIVLMFRNAANSNKVSIRVSPTNTFILRNEEDSANIGSASPVVASNGWNMIELKVDTTTLASTVIEARLDGSVFASGTIDIATGIARILMGIGNTSTCEVYLDDVALNDSNGSFQNSYPGSGKIVHLKPDAAGSGTVKNVMYENRNLYLHYEL